MGNTLRIRSDSPTFLHIARRSISSTSEALSPKLCKTPKRSPKKANLPAILEQHKECRNRVAELVQARTKLEKVEQRSHTQELDLSSLKEQLQDARSELSNITKIMIKCADPQDTDTKKFSSADQSLLKKRPEQVLAGPSGKSRMILMLGSTVIYSRRKHSSKIFRKLPKSFVCTGKQADVLF